MHALFERASGLTEAIIAAAIEEKLRACRSQGRGESPSDPQGATLELHEAAERSCRTTDQLPRDESHRWYPPVDSIWCEQISELIQQERTGFTCLCFLCALLFRIVVFQISRSPHCFDLLRSYLLHKSMPAAHMNTVCRSILFVFVISLAAITLKAQSLVPTPTYSDRAELSKVEQWVLSQGTVASIAPEIAATLGLGSDRLPVKLKSFRTSNDGISHAFAVSTNPTQKGIVLSALKTIENNKMKIYSLGTAWFTDRSGTIHRTIEVNASGVRVVSNNSHAPEFKEIKAFFPTTTSPPSP